MLYSYKCKIVRVVDGDTVDVDIDLGFEVWMQNQRIRLYGIDCPECRTRDKEEKAHGYLAKKFVEENLPVGSECFLNTTEKGKYGRYLGTLKMIESGRTINTLLLKAHLAVPYHGQSKDDIKKAHLANRKTLKKAGKL